MNALILLHTMPIFPQVYVKAAKRRSLVLLAKLVKGLERELERVTADWVPEMMTPQPIPLTTTEKEKMMTLQPIPLMMEVEGVLMMIDITILIRSQSLNLSRLI
jgi:hypothetical protein